MNSENLLNKKSEATQARDNHMPEQFVTAVISAIVKADSSVRYETWARRLSEAAKEFGGFLGADIIRPPDASSSEYILLLKFDTIYNLTYWQQSPTCSTFIANSNEFATATIGYRISYTLARAVSPGPSVEAGEPPAYYKLVVLGILAVYPLVLFTNFILSPILKELPYLIGVFLSVLVICLLMTYPVMPWLENVLRPWLYPASTKSSKLTNL